MAASISTTEPSSIRAGDTVTWQKTLADYSAADGWVLSYSGQRELGGKIQFSSSASGSDHLVEVSAATTVYWEVGLYECVSYVSKDGERFTIDEFQLEILPDLATAQLSYDPRSKAKKILDFIDASAEALAKGQTVESSVEGVSLKFRNLEEMMKYREYWLAVYSAEQFKASGIDTRMIRAKFQNA